MTEYIKKYQKLLVGIALGIATCLFAISVANPSQALNQNFPSNQIDVINYQNLAEAELIAQDESSTSSKIFQLKTYSAILLGDNVFPNPASSSASGAVGAALNGNRLIVRGGFRALSSTLRDYASDPAVPANPNITSGVHIHRGSSQQNGPFQYALQVTLSDDGLSGNLRGEYTLTDEQIEALNTGGLYVDIHTKSFRAGELRGVLKA
ncbi:MAG: CHRD domain-containing protein [Pseudanabaena sp.]|nr:MAG: CHRD domain-containing protein [Pseudanabaena sp.]